VVSNIIGQYEYISTNNGQELIPYIFEFKCHTNRIKKYFLSKLRFEPGSLGWTTNALANSAKLPLILQECFWEIFATQFFENEMWGLGYG
jgi:hypothetical protein